MQSLSFLKKLIQDQTGVPPETQILSEKIRNHPYEKKCNSTELLHNIQKPDPSYVILKHFDGVLLHVKMLDGTMANVKVPWEVRYPQVRLLT